MSQKNSIDPYFQQALEMKDRLGKVSPSFCLAKWKQVSIHLTTGRTHSCYHPLPHKIPIEEVTKNPAALHNTNFKKQQRKLMLEGQRPKECQYCWSVEDSGDQRISDRYFRSSEAWASESFEEVASNPWDWDVFPSYVEVNFNHACQFKCTYCSPVLSSAWLQEMQLNGPYPLIDPHILPRFMKEQDLLPHSDPETNPYVQAFWKWWPSLYSHLKVFRMTGGEPLLDENTFRVLDYVKKNPKRDLTLAVTSNFCPPQKSFQRFLKSVEELETKQAFQELQLFVSLDSVGADAEFVRWGLDFELFKNNIHAYLKAGPQRKIWFINTFNLFSIFRFSEFLDFILDLRSTYNSEFQRIHFDLPRLHAPEFMSASLIYERFQDLFLQSLKFMKDSSQKDPGDLVGFTSSEVEKCDRLLSGLKLALPSQVKEKAMTNFYLFFYDYQKRRKLSLDMLFPQLLPFYKECESRALEFLVASHLDHTTRGANS